METRAGASGQGAISWRATQEIRHRRRRGDKGAYCACGDARDGEAMSAPGSKLGACMLRFLSMSVVGAFGLAVLVLQSMACAAHEVRPAYLEVREDRAGE